MTGHTLKSPGTGESWACRYASPLGGISLWSDGEALTGLWFDGQQAAPERMDGSRQDSRQLPVFELTFRWLDAYFSGKVPDFSPPLRLEGTPFQKAVWALLLDIPYGQTRTYGEIATQLADQMGVPRMSAQAVGGAVGRNPISLIVPCHRVIGTHGRLVGYGGGLDRKAKLLALEQQGGVI